MAANAFVYKYLHDVDPHTIQKEIDSLKDLSVESGPDKWSEVEREIKTKYFGHIGGSNYAWAPLKAAIHKWLQQKRQAPSSSAHTVVAHGLEQAFQASYFGSAPQRLEEYLKRCAETYQNLESRYMAPYTTVVQSSGFGKSRLVRELAHVHNLSASSDMRVLYMCFRPPQSSGFPHATPCLNEFFFKC